MQVVLLGGGFRGVYGGGVIGEGHGERPSPSVVKSTIDNGVPKVRQRRRTSSLLSSFRRMRRGFAMVGWKRLLDWEWSREMFGSLEMVGSGGCCVSIYDCVGRSSECKMDVCLGL